MPDLPSPGIYASTMFLFWVGESPEMCWFLVVLGPCLSWRNPGLPRLGLLYRQTPGLTSSASCGQQPPTFFSTNCWGLVLLKNLSNGGFPKVQAALAWLPNSLPSLYTEHSAQWTLALTWPWLVYSPSWGRLGLSLSLSEDLSGDLIWSLGYGWSRGLDCDSFWCCLT